MTRRKHHKVATLPAEVVEAVNEMLVRGHTYEEIADWLHQMGTPVSRSAVGRYGKDFLARLERVKLARDQAKAIVESNAGEPGTQLAEATTELAMSMVMETLVSLDEKDGKKVVELLKVIPRLADSATRRESLKFQFNRGVDAAVNRFKEQLRKEIGSNHPELEKQIFAILDQVADQTKQAKV
ncbi:MAG: phage protein Gp27 family protein [Bacillota bacterium]